MSDTIIYYYYYGDEAEEFNYFRIPRLLITNPRFKFLSAEAKLLSKLDTSRGVGLVERVKQGQGKPTKLYVKRFTTRELPP